MEVTNADASSDLKNLGKNTWHKLSWNNIQAIRIIFNQFESFIDCDDH